MKTVNLLLKPLSIPTLFFIASCSWQPRSFYPNAFEPGSILDKGKTEIGAQLPFASVTVAHGFLNSGLEARGYFGFAGYGDMLGGGFSLGKSLTRNGEVAASILAGGDYIYSINKDEPGFSAYRASGTIAFGFRAPNDKIFSKIRIVLPVKIACMFYDFDGRRGSQLRGMPGLGFYCESKKLLIGLLFNAALPPGADQNQVQTIPYIGSIIAFKF